MKLLDGKTVIITGASRGIGNEIARTFAKEGANVAFTYSSSQAPAIALEQELNNLGVKSKSYKSNAANFQDSQDLIAAIIKDFDSIDVLINNML